jgi:hypothetical protein
MLLVNVIPAKAGIQANAGAKEWITAFAGMTVIGGAKSESGTRS